MGLLLIPKPRASVISAMSDGGTPTKVEIRYYRFVLRIFYILTKEIDVLLLTQIFLRVKMVSLLPKIL